MHPDDLEPARQLTRDEQKQLLVLACAADRLEWRLRAQRVAEMARRSVTLTRLLRAGWEWLPRMAGRGPAPPRPPRRRARSRVRTGRGLLG